MKDRERGKLSSQTEKKKKEKPTKIKTNKQTTKTKTNKTNLPVAKAHQLYSHPSVFCQS